jgi:hypothetical protein
VADIVEAYPVQQARNPPELEQLVLLQPLGKLDGIVLVVRLERAPESNVILFLDKQVVVRLVDNGDIELLGTDEVWLGEGEVVGCLEDLDNSAVIQPGSKGSKKVG